MKIQWSDFLIHAETYSECMNCKGGTDMVSISFNTYVCSGECEKELNEKLKIQYAQNVDKMGISKSEILSKS